jgi:hypothetical protein
MVGPGPSAAPARPEWVLAFPLLLAIGVSLIPVVTDYTNHILAEQAARHATRWFAGHVVSAIAFGFAILGGREIGRGLEEHGESRLATISVLFITVGAAFHMIGLGADGIGPLAVARATGTSQPYFDGGAPWVTGAFVAGSATFAVGLLTQVAGTIRAEIIAGSRRYLVGVASLVFVGAEAIPSGWGLYLVVAAAAAIYVPIWSGLRLGSEADPGREPRAREDAQGTAR